MENEKKIIEQEPLVKLEFFNQAGCVRIKQLKDSVWIRPEIAREVALLICPELSQPDKIKACSCNTNWWNCEIHSSEPEKASEGKTADENDILIKTLFSDWQNGFIGFDACLQKFSDQNTATLKKEVEGLKRQNGAYKTIKESQEKTISHYSQKAIDITNAIQTLESEREMNAILTGEIKTLEQDKAKAVDACQKFIDLFIEYDMRPEDECHELLLIMKSAIEKATI